MPKKHPFYSICVQDFRLVFRLPGDYGPIRTKATPQSPQVLENINSFVQRWKDIVHNDRYVLTKDSIEEIEKLKVHILKGCLSGITVGGGTNKNEGFHRYVRTFLHKSRIGILLAYALMTTIISNFNNNDKRSRKNRLRPIRLTLQTHEVGKPLERMGIMDNKDEDLTWIQEQDEDNDIDTILIDNILRVSLSQFAICKAMKKQTKKIYTDMEVHTIHTNSSESTSL